MSTLSEALGELGIVITPKQVLEMEKMALLFPLRKTHPLTFDGPTLGVHPIAFTTSDYNALFDLFDVDIEDVRHIINASHSINKSFKVQSDPFNILSVWLIHLAFVYIKNEGVRLSFIRNVGRYLSYRFFCSTVNNSFRYGTNEGVMQATVASLSKKSDIIRYESWRVLIDSNSHVGKLVNPEDRFYKVLKAGGPDKEFLSVLGEFQTSLRSKIVTFAQSYYAVHESGDRIGSHSAVAQNAEGEKILMQVASVTESATKAMVSELLNLNMFVRESKINDVVKGSSSVSASMLRKALQGINQQAIIQSRSVKVFDRSEQDEQGTVYVGIRALVVEIVRVTLRLAKLKRVNLGDHAQVYQTMKDAISSSRSLDVDVADIKRSVAHLIDPLNLTSNEAIRSALRLTVLYYIVYRICDKMKT